MTTEKVSLCNKIGDGTLGSNKLLKRYLLMIKEVDHLIGIGRLSGYHKGLTLTGDWIKKEALITHGMTTKL